MGDDIGALAVNGAVMDLEDLARRLRAELDAANATVARVRATVEQAENRSLDSGSQQAPWVYGYDLRAALDGEGGAAWRAGSPCGSCGSTNTTDDIVLGGVCHACHRTDADE